MELLMASGIGILTGTGVFLLLRPRTFETVLGLTLLSYAANLFIFSMGRLVVGRAPILEAGTSGHADPLPQALVLTAIVISFALTALLLVLAVRANAASGSDDVDGGQASTSSNGDGGQAPTSSNVDGGRAPTSSSTGGDRRPGSPHAGTPHVPDRRGAGSSR